MSQLIPLTSQLVEGNRLSLTQAQSAASVFLQEPSNENELEERTQFLKALASKGESPEEIAAFAQVFLDQAVDPGLEPKQFDGPLIDVCGTGGDCLDLFNVSTTSMFPLAAAGAVVVKHGNRGITSKCGGADVLESLGIQIDRPPQETAETIRRHGLGFLFAPIYHPAFKAVIPVRKALAQEGVRTVFNVLGPLLNPCRPPFQLAGVFQARLVEVYAEIFVHLGRTRAWTVCGTTRDGKAMDELSTLGTTRIQETQAGQTQEPQTLDPLTLGFQPAELSALTGGDAATNQAILLGILDGSDRGPRRDLVLLNAGAALHVAELADSLASGIQLAAEMIDSGKAMAKLQAVRGEG